MNNNNIYLEYIINRISSDVDFLLSNNHLSAGDARLIKLKLSNPTGPVNTLNPSANNSSTSLGRRGSVTKTSPLPSPPPHSMPSVAPEPPHHHQLPPQSFTVPPPPPVPIAAPIVPPTTVIQARAKWDYQGEPSDLRLVKGDVITVLEEVNADWWRGRNINGEEGLFPSNRVEKLNNQQAINNAVYPPRNLPPAPPSQSFTEKESYNSNGPPGIVYGSSTYNQSPYPPPGQYYNPPSAPSAPPAAPPTYVQQPDANNPEKKNKFKKFGNTMGHSFAGGAGFGAGAGLVGSLFN